MSTTRTYPGKKLTATLSLALVLVSAGLPPVKFSQPPDDTGEDAASNIDSSDLIPNVVVADDFVSDGRPITAVRWWGSNIPPDPKFCDSPFTCGGPVTECGTPPPGGFGCYCFKRPDGTTGNCAQDQFCNTTCPNGDIDCPAGQKCFIDTCCGPAYCFPNCPPPTGLLHASGPRANNLDTVDPSTGTITITGSGLTAIRRTPADARTPRVKEPVAPIQVPDGPVLNGVRVDAESAAPPMADTLPSVARVALGPGTLINFDDQAHPCNFAQTARLTTEYSGQGVTFSGPGGNDGGAILDQCGSFGVTGHSSPNFLAFNTESLLVDGGVPRGPETLWFSPLVSSVSVLAGHSLGGTLTMDAYDGIGNLVDSASIALTSTLAPVSVSAPQIIRVVISATGTVFVLDDLVFEATDVCPAPGNCCSAHDNAGCEDVSCCHAVCAADPYCCEVLWDGICVDEAVGICGTAGCKPAIDGWLVSFHEPLSLGGPPAPPLALYFCDTTIVTVAPTALEACDAHPVRQYDANLADCCLVRSYPDSRNGEIPGQKSAFLETACYNYDIDIQAVIGHKYVPRPDPKACDSPVTCAAASGCTGDPSCSCFFRPDGSGACAFAGDCNLPCSGGDLDCPAGTKCFLNTCCEIPVCLPNCPGLPPLASAAQYANAQRSGRMSSLAPSGTVTTSIPTEVVQAGPEANLAEGTLGLRYVGDGLPSQGGNVADAVAAFPSASSTVIGSVGFIDATQIGYFWSLARGDSVTESFATGESVIERAIFDFVVPNNSLAVGSFVNWDVLINATVIGDFTVVVGQVGPVHLDFSFAPLAGPNYTVRFRVTNQVPVNSGSHTLGYAGPHARTVRLVTAGNCVLVATGNTADSPFWGWHTTSVEQGLRPAVQSTVSISGPDLLYGPWNLLAPDCSEPNMAFQLFTDMSEPDVCDQPTVKKWESVVTHTRTGVTPIDIPLEITEDGLFSEPRGGVRRIVVTLDLPIDPTTATADNVNICGLKPCDVPCDVPGTYVPVDLSGVAITVKTSDGDTKLEINFNPRLPDFARYRMVLKGISGPGGPLKPGTGGLSRTFWALQGDMTGDDRVNATDVGGIRFLVPRDPINPAIEVEVRADINNDKRINATDVGGARSLVPHDARLIPNPVCDECFKEAVCSVGSNCTNDVCNCYFTAAGNTRCFFGEFLCADYPTPCTADSDCPAGSACSNDCCGMHCVPLCDGAAAAAPAPVKDYSAGTISGNLPPAPAAAPVNQDRTGKSTAD